MKNEKMKKIKHIAVISALAIVTSLLSCKKDKDLSPLPAPVNNPPEVITSLHLTFVDSSNTNNVQTFKFRDPDGDGGNPPVQRDTIKISANKTYSVSVSFFDETKNPIANITGEINSEKNDHQIFFNFSGVNAQSFYLDKDGNNLPVGLSNLWRVKAAATGAVKVVLKHQPDIKNNSQAIGESDADVDFQLKIQ